jgi:hypothetical protein
VPLSLLYSVNHTRLVQLYDEAYILPMIKVCQTRSRDPFKKGLNIFNQIAEKRLDVELIFGKPELINEIALFSGGNVREFIRILRNLVEIATPEDLPLSIDAVQFAFRRSIRDYETSPTDNDFKLLAKVYKSFEISNDNHHYRMLNNHFILAYTNGGTWYDIHPALREISKFKRALAELESREK